jgi:hypothetical protein
MIDENPGFKKFRVRSVDRIAIAIFRIVHERVGELVTLLLEGQVGKRHYIESLRQDEIRCKGKARFTYIQRFLPLSVGQKIGNIVPGKS